MRCVLSILANAPIFPINLFAIFYPLQFLTKTLEAVFKQFNYSDLMHAEFTRRATSQCVSESTTSRCVSDSVAHTRSIYIMHTHNSEKEFKIIQYNIASNCFENVVKLPFPKWVWNYGAVIYENKMFIMGENDLCSVSKEYIPK